MFFTKSHVQQYLHDIKRVLIPGGYCFIQYADCHYNVDLKEAKRGYWSYNTRTSMEKITCFSEPQERPSGERHEKKESRTRLS